LHCGDGDWFSQIYRFRMWPANSGKIFL